MGFLAPWFLAGLAAIGLPIWVHLLRQHKTTPRMFPSLMFFERRTQSSVKHRRLKYKALMALRIALLALLALAFAAPYLTRSIASFNAKRTVVLAIDRSFSMRQGERMSQAKREALSVLGKKAGASVQVIALGGNIEVLTQPAVDHAEARAAINSLEAGDGRAAYGAFARYLRTLAESSRLPVEAHLVTDLQRSAMPAGFADLRVSSDTTLALHKVGDAVPNYYVETVSAPRYVYDPKRVRIQATVAGSGNQKAQKTVTLAAGGKVQTKPVEIAAGGRATVEFLTLDVPYGWSRAEVRIDGGDGLAADDRLAFAVERSDPRKILFVHAARDTRSPLYFRAALEASAEGAFTMEARTSDQVAGLSPANYAFVVLSDPGSLTPDFEATLKRWVTGGGSVWIALGPATAALPKVPVTGDPLSGSRYAARDGERFHAAERVDAAHPGVRRATAFEGVKFYQSAGFDAPGARILARLTDQSTLLAERAMGEGRAVVFASTFDNLSNDLPLKPGFVPLVEQMARYLGGVEAQASNVAVDSFVELRTAKDSSGTAEVIGPDGKRALTLEEATKAGSFALRGEGFYEIRKANGRREVIAAHADRRESDLTPIAQETAELWQGAPKDGGNAAGQKTEESRPWSFWWWVLLLAAVAALAESLFANRYLNEERDQDLAPREKEAA